MKKKDQKQKVHKRKEIFKNSSEMIQIIDALRRKRKPVTPLSISAI
jgi:hypothetical protein